VQFSDQVLCMISTSTDPDYVKFYIYCQISTPSSCL